MPNLSVSVIVATYSGHRWDHLLQAIASLKCQMIKPTEVIVVVDHNRELFRRARGDLSDAIVMENWQPRGLAGARNSGLAVATSEIVAFLDDDGEALYDWLEKLLPAYSDDQVLGVGGAIDPAWEDGRPEWFPRELDWVIGCSYLGLPSSATPVRNLIGCNMSFRRHILLELGGFRNGIGRLGTRPLGCEETELCIRIRQSRPGGKLVYEPLARVRHRIPVERARWRYMVERCYAEGLSKAQVAEAVGSWDGLSTERRYVLRTLPHGVVRALIDSARDLHADGVRQAAAISLGLLLTIAGYCHGRLKRHNWGRSGGAEQVEDMSAVALGERQDASNSSPSIWRQPTDRSP